MALCRELTKLHESVLVGSVSSLLRSVGTPRGECTCVVWPAGAGAGDAPPPPEGRALLDELDRTAGGESRRDAVRTLAGRYGLTARAMYRAIEAARRE